MKNRKQSPLTMSAAILLAAAAGTANAQSQSWRVIFDIDTGSLAGTQFFGELSYDQATLNANFTDGILLAETGDFDFTVTLPGGVVLDLNEDPGAIAFFGGDALIGLSYLGDNGVEALNTFDFPNDLSNNFNIFLDPDFIPDGSGTFSFERLSDTDIETRSYNSTNTDIDDTDILSTPSDGDDVDEDTNFEGELEVSVDNDDGSGPFNPRQILIRFNDIMGSGTDQIPLGSTIIGAVFRVEIISPGSGLSAHRLLQPWDVNTTTWNTWGDGEDDNGLPGIQADGIDAAVAPDSSYVGIGGTVLSIDLTPSLQAFADGEPNEGFAILPVSDPTATDGVDFWTSEAPLGVPLRFFPPLLTVELADGTFRTFQEDQKGYTGTSDTTLQEGQPDVNFGQLNTTSIDLSDGGFVGQYLLRFEDLFGTDASQINPATDTIVGATLKVRSTSRGNDVAVYDLVRPFDEARETWASFGGGVDFDRDGTNLATNPAEVDLTSERILNTNFDLTNPAYSIDPVTGDEFITADLTSSLQKWAANPASNEGVAFLSLSTNGWDFDAEGTLLPPIGPQLFVSFIPPAGCNAADLASPLGSLTFADISAFLSAFTSNDPSADLADPIGSFTFADISAFLAAFSAGCP